MSTEDRVENVTPSPPPEPAVKEGAVPLVQKASLTSDEPPGPCSATCPHCLRMP